MDGILVYFSIVVILSQAFYRSSRDYPFTTGIKQALVWFTFPFFFVLSLGLVIIGDLSIGECWKSWKVDLFPGTRWRP